MTGEIELSSYSGFPDTRDGSLNVGAYTAIDLYFLIRL